MDLGADASETSWGPWLSYGGRKRHNANLSRARKTRERGDESDPVRRTGVPERFKPLVVAEKWINFTPPPRQQVVLSIRFPREIFLVLRSSLGEEGVVLSQLTRQSLWG